MITINVGAQVSLGLTYDPDANGLSTDLLPAVPVWGSSDDRIATVVQSEDGRTASLLAVAPGSVRINVLSGDLSDSLDCDISLPLNTAGITTGIHIMVVAVQEPT